MAFMHIQKLLCGAKYLTSKPNRVVRMTVVLYHCSGESPEEFLPGDWYEKMFPKLTRIARSLEDVDLIDGRLVNVNDKLIIIDDNVEQRMRYFKSLTSVFIGSSLNQMRLKETMVGMQRCGQCTEFDYFSKPSERQPVVVNSLTKISSVLNISAQQRKLVRIMISPQVTQHQIWRGALEEILNGLKVEIDLLNFRCPSKGIKMAQQIISSCLKFLADSTLYSEPDSCSWMRPAPVKIVNPLVSCKWEDVLEMFNDLIKYLKGEKGLENHMTKLEVMKEGLFQIKDVLVDNSIGYREARHHQSLVQKKLSKTLGHSSRCLFTLLLYYLNRRVRDIEVDLCGGFYENEAEKRFCLSMGRILTSKDEKMIQRGVKQLDRALSLFKFVWETAGKKDVLELQGHLWCIDSEERSLAYRGNAFFVHGISI